MPSRLNEATLPREGGGNRVWASALALVRRPVAAARYRLVAPPVLSTIVIVCLVTLALLKRRACGSVHDGKDDSQCGRSLHIRLPIWHESVLPPSSNCVQMPRARRSGAQALKWLWDDVLADLGRRLPQ